MNYAKLEKIVQNFYGFLALKIENWVTENCKNQGSVLGVRA